MLDSSLTGGSLTTPKQQFTLTNQINITGNIFADTTARFVDQSEGYPIEDCFTMDARIGWRPRAGLELSINGRNLLDHEQFEFVELITNRATTGVERSIYGQVTWEY